MSEDACYASIRTQVQVPSTPTKAGHNNNVSKPRIGGMKVGDPGVDHARHRPPNLAKQPS